MTKDAELKDRLIDEDINTAVKLLYGTSTEPIELPSEGIKNKHN